MHINQAGRNQQAFGIYDFTILFGLQSLTKFADFTINNQDIHICVNLPGRIYDPSAFYQ
jgi:hypothetical protein